MIRQRKNAYRRREDSVRQWPGCEVGLKGWEAARGGGQRGQGTFIPGRGQKQPNLNWREHDLFREYG